MKWFPNRSKTAGSGGGDVVGVASLRLKSSSSDPVAEYKTWTARGAVLADARSSAVPDPLSNPDTVAHLRRRAEDASHAAIEADYARAMHAHRADARRMRVADEAADSEITYRLHERDEARDQLRRITAARSAHDPATAAAEMSRAGDRYVNRYLRISWAASTLAALGLGSVAYRETGELWVGIGAGLLGEVILTFLIGQIVAGMAELDKRQGLARDGDGNRIISRGPGWASKLPYWGVGGLLAASIALNVHGIVMGTGIIGALGVIGALVATLATLLAWAYSASATATVQTLLSDRDIAASTSVLDEVASGARIPRIQAPQVSPEAPAVVSPTLTRDEVLAAVAADPSLIDDAITGVVDTAIEHMTAPVAEIDQVDAHDVEDDTDDGESMESGAVAIADRPNNALAEGARRATRSADANRAAVTAAYDELLSETGEAPTAAEIARRVGLSDRTVRRHLQNGQ